MNLEDQKRLFNIKYEMIKSLSDMFLKEFPDYSYDDINYHDLFMVAETCINRMVDACFVKEVSKYNCNRCCGEE